MAGIPLGSSFDRTSAVALDSLYVAADTTARDAIVSGVRYQGMQCFVVADQTKYILKTGITNSDWAVDGGTPVPAPVVDLITASGSAAFTVTSAPGVKENVQVFMDGVRQSTALYSVSGTTVTMTFTPYTGAEMMFITGATLGVNIPSPGSVVTASIAAAAITPDKMAAKVKALYTGISKSVSNGGYVYDADTQVYDSNTLVTTGASWKFKNTLGRPMRVCVRACIKFASASWTAGNNIQLQVTNGVTAYDIANFVVQNTATQVIPGLAGSFEWDLANNDEVWISIFQNSGSSKTLANTLNNNYIEITEVI